MESVAFSYDGTSSLTAVITGATNGQLYSLTSDDGASTPASGTAVGTSITLNVTGIGGITVGTTFDVYAQKGPANMVGSDYIGATVYTFNTGSTAESTYPATWAFDGNQTVSVTFASTNAVVYEMQVVDVTGGGSTPVTVTGDGTSKTLTVVFGAPDVGTFFEATLYTHTAFYPVFSNRMFAAGVANGGYAGNPGGGPAPSPTITTWTFLLCDIKTDTTLVDLSGAFLNAQIKARLNRPLQVILTIPCDTPDIFSTAADGDINLVDGTRSIKAYRNGTLRGHVIIWNLEYSGDANTRTVQITGYDPLILLLRRPVRDATGNLIDPTFTSPISGAAIIRQAIENSVSNSGPAGDMEGALPIDTSAGTFDTTIPPAVDLGADLTDWPIMIGDLATLLTDTGVLDIVIDPVDSTMGFTAGIIGKLNILNKAGADLTGSVNFDYNTGAGNVQALRRVFDCLSLCNKLYYYLGPKLDEEHWKGNITATETTPVNLAAWLALETASRSKYWTLMDISIYDTATENDARPMFHTLWGSEVTVRVNPRQLLYVTPVADAAFAPFDTYNLADTFSVNVAGMGPTLTAGVQRIYGFDITIDGSESVERVGELITSADAE